VAAGVSRSHIRRRKGRDARPSPFSFRPDLNGHAQEAIAGTRAPVRQAAQEPPTHNGNAGDIFVGTDRLPLCLARIFRRFRRRAFRTDSLARHAEKRPARKPADGSCRRSMSR